MKTSDVKVGVTYYCLDTKENATVTDRIKGGEKSAACMQSGNLFVGFHRKQKKFRLSNGLIVKADRLETLK